MELLRESVHNLGLQLTRILEISEITLQNKATIASVVASKVCGPYAITLLNQTLIFEWQYQGL